MTYLDYYTSHQIKFCKLKKSTLQINTIEVVKPWSRLGLSVHFLRPYATIPTLR